MAGEQKGLGELKLGPVNDMQQTVNREVGEHPVGAPCRVQVLVRRRSRWLGWKEVIGDLWSFDWLVS